MARWRARLFGSFSLAQGGVTLDVPSAISRSLLAYVLVTDAPVHRDVIVDRLWPHQDPTDARNTLSQAIWKFKNAVGFEIANELLDISHDWLSIRSEADIFVDAIEFDGLLRTALRSDTTHQVKRQNLEDAIDLYEGDFALGLFDPWVTPRQRYYRNQVSEALDSLWVLQAADGDFVQSLSTLRRLAQLVPQRESVHRQIMKSLHLLGRRAEAIEYFDEVATTYRSEYGRDPSAEMRALFRAIESGSQRHHPPGDDASFIGRSSEVERVVKLVMGSLASRGELIFVEGEPGIGRTAFVGKVASELYWRECRVVSRTCDDARAGSYATMVALIRELLDGSSVLRIESMVPPVWVKAAARLIPELSRYLGLDPTTLPPVENETRRTRESLAKVLIALLSKRPGALILDDVHRVDPDTGEMLEELIERVALAGCTVIVSYSSDALAVRPGVIDSLSAADRTIGSETVTIPRFERHESAEYIRTVGDLVVSPLTEADLHDQSGGVPLYLGLLLKAAGSVLESGEIHSGKEMIPTSLSSAIARRLAGISQEDCELMEVLAVADRGLSEADLAGIIGDPVESGLARLVRGGHARESEGMFEIDLDLARDGIISSLEPMKLRSLHRMLAAWIAGQDGASLAEFAHHAEHGGLHQAAALAYVLLAEEFLSLNAPAAATHHFELAIDAGQSGGLDRKALWVAVRRYVDVLSSINQPPIRSDLADVVRDLASTDAERLEALRLTAELFMVEDRFVEAAAACSKGLALTTSPSERGAFGLLLARIRRLQGDALVGALEIEEILAMDGLPLPLRVQLLTSFGMLLLSTSRTDELQHIIAEGLDLVDDDMMRADLLNVRALRELEAGNIAESILRQREVYDLAARVGYQHRMAVSQWNLSISHLNLDQVTEAITAADAAIELGRNIGSVYVETMAGLALASALYETVGSDQQVDDLVRVARTFGRRHRVTSAETWAAELEALLAHDKGHAAEAKKMIDHAVERNRELDLMWGVLNALLSRALIALDSGFDEAALADIDEASRYREHLKSKHHLGPIRAMRALALSRLGDVEAAMDSARAALAEPMTWYSRHRSYLLLADAFGELGDEQGRADTIELAYEHLNRRAARLPQGLKERAFRSGIAERIVETWLVTKPRISNTRLRNHMGEMVSVEWTVSRPDDILVGDLRARRRHRIQRMVAQARAAGVVSPPIKELAAIFRVSETTVR
ncbi:MAG: AAA family ATPase, partial [Acidimicrobiia bacterium]|nr:AAA family ATPase [Acidimicrobiia bacterium]